MGTQDDDNPYDFVTTPNTRWGNGAGAAIQPGLVKGTQRQRTWSQLWSELQTELKLMVFNAVTEGLGRFAHVPMAGTEIGGAARASTVVRQAIRETSGAQAVTRATAGRAPGAARITVIGMMKDVEEFAGPGFDHWAYSGPAQNPREVTQVMNKAWLLARVNRGDIFILATPRAGLEEALKRGGGRGTLLELQWLKQVGITPGSLRR